MNFLEVLMMKITKNSNENIVTIFFIKSLPSNHNKTNVLKNAWLICFRNIKWYRKNFEREGND